MADTLDLPDHSIDQSESRDAVARRLLEGVSTHAIFMLDGDGRIVTWPAAAAALYGHDAEAVLDRHVRLLFDDDGTGVDSFPDGFFADPTAEAVEFDHRHRRADGSGFRATLTLSPQRNDAFHGYAAISQDTTKTTEYERMLERQNDRLKAFTDALAHDLRNPLTIIDGNLTLYEDTGDEEHLEAIDETTDRMARLVEDLLRGARRGNVVTEPDQADTGEVIDTAWEGLDGDSDSTHRYERFESVGGDTDRLCELLESLFRNALGHKGDDVTVRVGPLDASFSIEGDGSRGSDGGDDRVFDRGVATIDADHGDGLSVVRTFVDAHGWEMVATDARTGGVRFDITERKR